MDIKKFLQELNEHIRYAEYDKGYLIAFPFKFLNDSQISPFFISEDESGLFTITDNGNTIEYLLNMGVNPEDYADKIEKICEAFDLTYEDGTFKGILGEYETNQTFTMLSKFFMGIAHISTVHRF